MKKKLIYILALSHTGSTILSLELARAFGGLAIGESFYVFKHSTDNTEGVAAVCSCGKELASCPLWGRFAGEERADVSRQDQYRELLAQPLVAQAPFLIDSSKKTQLLPLLKELRDGGEADPFVIFLVRDVRGWALSDRDAWRRKDGVAGARKKWFPLARHFYSWLRSTEHFERELRASGLPYLTVGYEQFCFDQKNTFEKIKTAADLPVSHGEGTHHVAYSNRMKMDGGKVVYDSRWMRSWSASALYALFPGIAKKNTEWVYGDASRT